MKKIFNLFTHQISCVVAMMMLVGVSYGQCPMNETQLCVTYVTGGFNAENGWALWNASTSTPIAGFQNPAAGVSMFCVPDGDVIELYAFETFGDGWCPPAMISVAACEDGSNNGGCVNNSEYIAPTSTTAAGNGGFTGANHTAGELVPTSNPAFAQIVTGCSECEIECPDDVTVSNSVGLCGAFFECPPPTFDPVGCNLEAAINVIEVNEFMPWVDFVANTGNMTVGTYNTTIDLGSICNFPMPVCVDEICIDTEFAADFGGNGFEQIQINNGPLGIAFDSDPDATGDCQLQTFQLCLDAAGWDAFRGANCMLNFEVVVLGNGIDADLCADAQDGIRVSTSMATACDTYATCIAFADGTSGFKADDGFLPIGCNTITYKAVGGTFMPDGGGTGSGTGSGTTGGGGTFGPPGIPIECSYKVTVEDDEAPVFSCPQDRTFNLQSGECCEIADFDVVAIDNCDDLDGECVVMSGVTFDGCDPSAGGGSTFDQIMFDVTNTGPTTLILTKMYQPVFAAGTYSWNVHTIAGGFAGNQTNAGAWTLVNMPVATMYGAGQVACLPLSTPIVIAPGATVGIALSFPMSQTGSFGLSYAFAACTPVANPNGLTISAGQAPQFQFGGTVLNPRFFVGFFDYLIDIGASTGAMDIVEQTSGIEAGSAIGVGVFNQCFSAMDCSGNMSECKFTLTVNEVPGITSNLTCDNSVNVSVDENCMTLITAGMFLEGGPYGCEFDCYEVYIEDEHGHAIESDCIAPLKADLDNGDVGPDVNGCTIKLDCGEYTYRVYDACRDNECWGNFVVEDKLAPTIVDPADATVSCIASTLPGPDCLGSVAFSALDFDTELPFTWVAPSTAAAVHDFCIPVSAGAGLLPGAIVTSLSIDVDLSHDWISELDLVVTGPNGATSVLFDSQCGQEDHIDATFSDSGVAAACAGLNISTALTDNAVCGENDTEGATLTGTIMPFTPLAPLLVGDVTGDWCFQLTQDFIEFGGCLEDVRLNFDFVVPGIEAATLAGGIKFVDSDGNPVDETDPGAIEIGCDDDLTFIDDVTEDECNGTTIRRVWVATDAKGNQSTESQIITVEVIGAEAVGTSWFWPAPVVELNCGVDYSPQGIYDYYRGLFECATPCPDPLSCDEKTDPYVKSANTAGVFNAFPQILCDKLGNLNDFTSNSCQLKFTYEDRELEACPGCPGNLKIIRTWIALDWCTAETVEFNQIIHAKDTEGPVIDMDGITNVIDGGCGPDAFTTDNITITVGANPWGCAADFVLPAPEHLTDNCSTDIEYTVSGPATVSFEPVEGGPGRWVVSGAPKGTHVFTYTATDCCGNEGIAFVTVNVIDNSPPTMIGIQNIVVGLTFSPTNPEAGSAKIFVDQVDNGSHDGSCGPVKLAIRRVDGDGCGNVGLNGWDNNSTFFNFNDLRQQDQPTDHARNDTDGGKFVKFCCNDLLTGEGEDLDGDGVNDYVNIMVELGAWDDANMDGWPGTPGDLFNRTWVNVRLEAKVNPVISCPPNAMITCDLDENSELVIRTTLGRAAASTACGVVDATYTDVCGWNQNAAGADGILGTNDDDTDFDDTFTMMGETVHETFNKGCHYGPIVRTWSIANSKSCEQIIIVKEPTTKFSGSYYLTDVNNPDKAAYADYILLPNGNPISNNSIVWPFGNGYPNSLGGNEAVDINDDNFDDYSEVQLDCVDDLGDHQPTWVNEHCSLVGWSLETDTINFEGDACRKIINQYCVIDWCQYDPTLSRETYNPNDPESISFYARNGDLDGTTFGCGKWCWTVIGKLVDPYAPIVTAPDEVFPANPSSGGSGGFPSGNVCVGNAAVTATAFDGTTNADGEVQDDACPSSWLEWVVLVDLFDDWVYDYEYSSFIIRDNPNPIPYFTDSNGNGIPDVQVGESPFDSADSPKTGPGDYTITIPANIPADCGETKHRVEWTVYDGCGNVSSTTSYFTVQDQKAPTPYCVNLSTALMEVPPGGGPEDACVELWAIDFDFGSFDNCTSDEELEFTFNDDRSTVIPGRRSAAMKFDCESLAGADMIELTLPVYVWDICGNRDFCLVNLRVIDTKGNCGGTGTGSITTIAGTIETETGHTIDNVEVMNKEMSTGSEEPAMSDLNGYAFYSDMGGDYELSGTKNDDYSNGVSTVDIVMIQRHILGIQELDSAYELIAADINNDQKIDGADLVELRKLVLGIYTELPQNDSWRFIDADFTLDVNNPWNFDETREVMDLSTEMMNENFIGVKIGDVSGDVIANATQSVVNAQSSSSIQIGYEDIAVSAGQTVQLTVTAEQANIYGYQFTLATPGLQLVDVTAGNLNVTAANFGVFGEVITTSWNDTNPISATGDLFTMTFKSSVEGQLSDILDLNSEITRAEAYVGSNMDVIGITLDDKAGVAEFALMQNEPNPFSATTTVGFVMAEAADATITVYDIAGKVISIIDGAYPQGYNEIELSKSDLGASGVLYYQLDSGDFTATKKMIVIE